MGSKKAKGEHRRIDIRRSIRKGGLKVINKKVGSWGKSKSPWIVFHGALVFE